MKETFKELITYIKNPVLESDPNLSNNYRFTKLFHLILICIITGFLTTPIFSVLEYLEIIDLENHAVEKAFEGMPKLLVFLLAAIIVPAFEELIFRAPITVFKNPKVFKIAFYTFTLLFGFVHITNFEINNTVLLLTPLLVLPQLLVGAYFGFIRVRFGLIWSIFLHGSYNGILFLITFISE